MQTSCKALTRTGHRCRKLVQPGWDYCGSHRQYRLRELPGGQEHMHLLYLNSVDRRTLCNLVDPIYGSEDPERVDCLPCIENARKAWIV